MRAFGLRYVAAAVLPLLAACANPDSFTVPTPVPPAGGNLPASGAWDGQYKGVARSSAPGCQKLVPVSDFYVTSNRVSFSSLFGVVKPNGEAVLETTGPALTGRFNAGRFEGSGIIPDTDYQGCTYQFSLARVGPG
jgi:hypothetical protein